VIPKRVTVYTKGSVSQILTLPGGTSVLISPERHLLDGQKVNAHNISADFKMAGNELNVENICLDHSSGGSFRTTMYAHHRARITLIEKIAKGDWNPDSNFGDKEQRDGLAARGSLRLKTSWVFGEFLYTLKVRGMCRLVTSLCRFVVEEMLASQNLI
jgi:hypothetical protein